MPQNTPTKSVADFNFTENTVDLQDLTRAWDAALEEALLTLTHDNKVNTFLIAGVKVGLRYKKISANAVALMSGYSKSTFFRLFPNVDHFTEQGFFLVNSLIIKIYEKHVYSSELTLEGHVDLILTLCVGAYAVYPADILKRMSEKHNGDIVKIHPHTPRLAEAIIKGLHHQAATRDLAIEYQSLIDLLFMLDDNLMRTALQCDGTLLKPTYFDFLYKVLHGFLAQCHTNDAQVFHTG